VTSLGVKLFHVLNTTINIKDILWRRLENSKIWRIYTSVVVKGLKVNYWYSSETPTFYQNYWAMSNTADGTGDKPIAVWSQSISDLITLNPLIAFYDIHGRKRDVLLFYSVPNTTRDQFVNSANEYEMFNNYKKIIML
jgi:hypothetical protein